MTYNLVHTADVHYTRSTNLIFLLLALLVYLDLNLKKVRQFYCNSKCLFIRADGSKVSILFIWWCRDPTKGLKLDIIV